MKVLVPLEICKWNEMHFKHFGEKREWIEVAVCVCGVGCVCARAYVQICACSFSDVCGYTDKERKSESGLSVISVTLSGSLPLTNERCWQPHCILPWLCWVGQICFRAFVRFNLSLLHSLSLPLLPSFSPSECQGEQWPLVSPKDTPWHSTW